MIIILDDTFKDRHKYNDVEFLKNEKYAQICEVRSIVKTTDLKILVSQLHNCQLLCNHRSLQFYNINNEPLNEKDNVKNFDSLISKIKENNIQRIEFSRGLESNIEISKIDKNLFYSNLNAFLDYYITNNVIELKILYFGEDFLNDERFTKIQKMMALIQMKNIKTLDYYEIPEIKKGLEILYPGSIELTIKNWELRNMSKKDIINIINLKLK